MLLINVSRGILRAHCTPLLARVVKLVDTGDLKSPGHCGRAGSSPAPGTNFQLCLGYQYTVNESYPMHCRDDVIAGVKVLQRLALLSENPALLLDSILTNRCGGEIFSFV